MSIPARSAISMSVSVAEAVTSRPSSTKVTVGASVCARISRVTAFIAFSLSQFVGKIFDDRVHGIRRRLPQPANGRVAHDLGELRQQRLVPIVIGDERIGLGGAYPAGRALPAGFVFKKTYHIARRRFGGILRGQYDHG